MGNQTHHKTEEGERFRRRIRTHGDGNHILYRDKIAKVRNGRSRVNFGRSRFSKVENPNLNKSSSVSQIKRFGTVADIVEAIRRGESLYDRPVDSGTHMSPRNDRLSGRSRSQSNLDRSRGYLSDLVASASEPYLGGPDSASIEDFSHSAATVDTDGTTTTADDDEGSTSGDGVASKS